MSHLQACLGNTKRNPCMRQQCEQSNADAEYCCVNIAMASQGGSSTMRPQIATSQVLPSQLAHSREHHHHSCCSHALMQGAVALPLAQGKCSHVNSSALCIQISPSRRKSHPTCQHLRCPHCPECLQILGTHCKFWEPHLQILGTHCRAASNVWPTCRGYVAPQCCSYS